MKNNNTLVGDDKAMPLKISRKEKREEERLNYRGSKKYRKYLCALDDYMVYDKKTKRFVKRED